MKKAKNIGEIKLSDTKCIVCGVSAKGMWFCPFHTKVKEEAYKEAERLGLKKWEDIMNLRDKRLREKNE